MKSIQESTCSHLWELKFNEESVATESKIVVGMGQTPGAITSKLFWAGCIGMLQTVSGWWFGTCVLFPCIWNVIIPIDELICFRGFKGQPPTSVDLSDGISYEIPLNHHIITI